MSEVTHPTLDQLEAGLDELRRSPKDGGVLDMIVCRPRTDAREVLEEACLDVEQGLVGDNWRDRGSKATADGLAHADMQLNIMNARAAALVARDRGRWALAGDQLYLDMDLSDANLPPGTQLALGSAVIEVTAEPHTGCKKFMARFGKDALKFVNSKVGLELRLRGINAKVVRAGTIRTGDVATKL